MKFNFNNKACEIEIFSNSEGIVAKFYNSSLEPKEHEMIDYVFVNAGYGYISLKKKGEEGLLSGLLKYDFFDSNAIITYAIDVVLAQIPELADAYIPYNLERIQFLDAMVYTGETFEDVDENHII